MEFIKNSQIQANETSFFYEKLASEMIVSLRKDRSQKELSELLGYRFNQVGKWESGATRCSWNDFFLVCKINDICLEENILEHFCWSPPQREFKDHKYIINHLLHFFGHANLTDASRSLHRSKPVISRWQRGVVEPSLSDVLQFIDSKPFILVNWIRSLLHEDLAILSTKIEIEKTTLTGLLSHPVVPIVNACLHLEEYKQFQTHSNEWISKKIAEPIENVEMALKILENFHIVEYRNQKFWSYLTNLSMYRIPNFRVLTKHLTRKMANLFDEGAAHTPNLKRPSMSSTSLHPLSDEAAIRLVESISRFHREISKIALDDKGIKTHVRALVLHSIDCEISGR